MLLWIQENISTIIIAAVILAAAGLIIASMIRNKKKGKSSCGCGCENCAMRGSCHDTKR